MRTGLILGIMLSGGGAKVLFGPEVPLDELKAEFKELAGADPKDLPEGLSGVEYWESRRGCVKSFDVAVRTEKTNRRAKRDADKAAEAKRKADEAAAAREKKKGSAKKAAAKKNGTDVTNGTKSPASTAATPSVDVDKELAGLNDDDLLMAAIGLDLEVPPDAGREKITAMIKEALDKKPKDFGAGAQ